jgi:glycosyltransferase involved in cell wall biosynthesis
MRIVFICNEYPPRPHAGIGTAVQTIARGLSQKDHEVTVVGLGEANEESTDDHIRVVTLRRNKIRYIGNLISRLRLRRWLTARVKAGTADVIEVPDAEGLLPFPINGCVVVIRLHLSYTAASRVTGESVGPGISFYEKRTVKKNSNWIAVSDYIEDLTQATFDVSPKRSITVYNAVPPLPSLPVVQGLPEKYILYAGHVCRRKGADVLAEAVREVMTQQPDLHLVYVGGIFNEDGRSMSEHIRDIIGPKLVERVHFLGRVDREKTLACMTHAKVFAFPSHVEACPLVVLEAMSCGVPVVFTKNPPGPEIVEDGVTGLLADPLSPKDFSEKILRILDDPSLARKLAENARKFVAWRFSVGKCIEATERFYVECLKC